MTSEPAAGTSSTRPDTRSLHSAWAFYLLVTALAVPFWILGATPDPSSALPMGLPLSAFGFVAPIAAAVILTYREAGWAGTRRLLLKCLDPSRIRTRWYVPTLLLMPAVLLFSYLVMRLIGRSLPEAQIAPLDILLLFALFSVTAFGEEVGWTGFAMDPLLERWNALQASLVLGLFWALWHVIPWLETRPGLDFAAWQAFGAVALRVLMVWIYLNSGRSPLAVVLFHASINVSDALFPNNGSGYDPAIAGLTTAFAAVVVLALWGARTLAKPRYARSGAHRAGRARLK